MKRTGFVGVGLTLLFLAADTRAQAPAPTPGPEHKKLEAFVGNWTFEGSGRDDSVSPEHKIVWTIEARWILGGFFVEFNHIWKARGEELRTLEIVGYDTDKKGYTSHVFLPRGTVEACDVVFKDRTYVISGTSIRDGKEVKWSCTWIFGPEGTSQSGKCESAMAGARWTTFTGGGTKTKAP